MATVKDRFTRDWTPKVPHLGYKGEIGDLRSDVEVAIEGVAEEAVLPSSSAAAILSILSDLSDSMAAALNEDLVMSLLSGDLEESVPISEVNAADAGTYEKEFTVVAATAGGTLHAWAGLTAAIVPTEACSDGDIGEPEVSWKDRSGTPAFLGGQLALVVTMDTDAGATKTYQAGTKSTGDFTCVAQASVTDGGVLTLEDAYGTVKTFEADPAGDGVGGSNIQVNLSGLTTDVEVANKYREVINAQTDLRMTASGSTAVVDLTQDDALAAGDTTVGLDATMVSDGFTKTDFSGGVDRDEVTVPVDLSGISAFANVPVLTKKYYFV